VHIREFQVADYQEVVALWRAAGLDLNRSDSLEGIRKKLERDADLFLVVQQEGRIVGVVMGSYDGRRGWISRLAVSPALQRTGLGSRLVARVEECLRAKGCEKVNLFVTPSNGGVRGFYERLGYTTDELIFMEKWLVEDGADRRTLRAGGA
jgi:ribosomal protein S18 acetylase RimI-like enzyme